MQAGFRYRIAIRRGIGQRPVAVTPHLRRTPHAKTLHTGNLGTCLSQGTTPKQWQPRRHQSVPSPHVFLLLTKHTSALITVTAGDDRRCTHRAPQPFSPSACISSSSPCHGDGTLLSRVGRARERIHGGRSNRSLREELSCTLPPRITRTALSTIRSHACRPHSLLLGAAIAAPSCVSFSAASTRTPPPPASTVGKRTERRTLCAASRVVPREAC